MATDCLLDNFISALDEDLEKAKIMLKTYPEVKDMLLSEGVPILIHYIWEKKLKVVEFLLENGFNPNIRYEKYKCTPLSMVAITRNNIFFGEILLKFGADMYLESCESHHVYTNFVCPFFEAVKTGNLEIVKLLLKNGFDPFYRDSHGKGIESYLPENEEQKKMIINCIYEMKSSKNLFVVNNSIKNPVLSKLETNITSLILYCEKHIFELAKSLVQSFPELIDVNDAWGPILFRFMDSEDDLVVDFLLSIGFNPNLMTSGGLTPLANAIIPSSVIVPFTKSKLQSSLQNIKSLIKYGVDINLGVNYDIEDGNDSVYSHECVHPYHLAVYSGRIDVMKLLIDKGVKPFYIDTMGRTLDYFLPPKHELGEREKVLNFLEKYK